MKRLGLLAVLALAASAGMAANAHASELQTWETPSSHVDPQAVLFNSPPPGAAPRPNTLRVNVLLPDGYDGRRRFPVLYLLHGHGDAFDYWANPQRGNVQEIAKDLNAIVVMPEGARGWYTNWWNGGRRGAPAWERYHLDELIPLVEQRLKVRPGRRWHAIAGLSMGGLGTMYYASQRPGYFGSAASFSGALSLLESNFPLYFDFQGERHVEVYGDANAQRFYWEGHDPVRLIQNLRHTRLFVSVGDGTPLQPTNPLGSLIEVIVHGMAEQFVAAARAEGADLSYQPHPGIHDWPYWRTDLSNAIDWGLFREVTESPSRWTYETVAQRGSAWALDFEFAEPPATLIGFSREGNLLRASGSGRVTITGGDGCPFTADLPFERTLPDPSWVRTLPRLRLRVRPRTVRGGERRRFRFRVTTSRCGRRLPVKSATIAFGRRTLKTNARGRARLSARLRTFRRVRASKPGYTSSISGISVVWDN